MLIRCIKVQVGEQRLVERFSKRIRSQGQRSTYVRPGLKWKREEKAVGASKLPRPLCRSSSGIWERYHRWTQRCITWIDADVTEAETGQNVFDRRRSHSNGGLHGRSVSVAAIIKNSPGSLWILCRSCWAHPDGSVETVLYEVRAHPHSALPCCVGPYAWMIFLHLCRLFSVELVMQTVGHYLFLSFFL